MLKYTNVPGDPEAEAHLRQFIDQIQPHVPGRLLFVRVSGSRGYNLARPDSDWDFQGVYAAPTTRMLGLDGEPRTFPGDEYGHLDLPNCCVYEAHKFSKLLLGGNPMAVEMLFGSHISARSPEWEELLPVIRLFLTRDVPGVAIRFARGQAARYVNRSPANRCGGKWQYHYLRMLYSALSVAGGGDPLVWVEGPVRDRLMAVRAGAETDEVIAEGDALVLQVEERIQHWATAQEPTYKPELVAHRTLEDWLVRTVRGVT